MGLADGAVCLPLLRIVYTAQNLIVRYTLTTSDVFLWMPPLFYPLAEAFPSSESLPTRRLILWIQRDARGRPFANSIGSWWLLRLTTLRTHFGYLLHHELSTGNCPFVLSVRYLC